jgi:hypothetical protein
LQRWHKTVVAAAALVGAASLGVAVHAGESTDQQMTLTASQAAQGGAGYSFAVRATPVDGLYPGADRRLVLTLENPFSVDLIVTDIHANLVATSRPGCAPTAKNLQVQGYNGRLPVRVEAEDSREAGVVPLHMPNTVVDACQQATFTIALDAVASRAS